MTADQEQKLGQESKLPEMHPSEVVLFFAPKMDELLAKLCWFRRRIDEVVVSGYPQVPLVENTRSVLRVNGGFKCFTDKALIESLPALAETWGCDLNRKPLLDTYPKYEKEYRVPHIVVERSFVSAKYPRVSLVFERIFSGSNGKFVREDMILRRTFGS